MGIVRIAFIALALFSIGCAQGHCRRKATTPGVKPVSGSEAAQSEAKGSDRILVYKYDGSVQCRAGRAVSLEVMAKELKDIQIFSQQKKSDGLMHITACDSITGMANVYEISSTALKFAEAKGFKLWNFE